MKTVGEFENVSADRSSRTPSIGIACSTVRADPLRRNEDRRRDAVGSILPVHASSAASDTSVDVRRKPSHPLRRHGYGGDDDCRDSTADARIVRDRFKTARKAMRALPAADHTRFALAAQQCTLGRYVESDRRRATARPEEITILDWVIWAVGAFIENRDQRRAVMAYIAGAKMVEIGEMLGGSRSRQAVERRLVRVAEKLSQSVPSSMLDPKKSSLR